MTHPITGHSDRCLCTRCDQVVDVPALIAQRDELAEKLALLEAEFDSRVSAREAAIAALLGSGSR